MWASPISNVRLTPAPVVAVPRGDEGSSTVVNLGFTFEFFGSSYTQMYVNNNGNVTFGRGQQANDAIGLPQDLPMLAPFWSDVDTTGVGEVRLSQGLSVRNQPYVQVDWLDVGYFNGHTDLQNTFTLYLEDDPSGDLVMFKYLNLEWTSGDAGKLGMPGGTGGFGGPGALVGMDAGNDNRFIELARPATQSGLDALTGLPNQAYAWRFDPATGQPVTFTLEPLFLEQELGGALGGVPYWEGACRVLNGKGQEVGLAYLELTGYAGDLSERFR